MGTDINAACEIRNKKTGEWKLMEDLVFEDPYEGGKSSVPYRDRNYNLFAILADVRNGTGFAGCTTGEKFEPISDPKGYPDDMDPNTEMYLSGEHSASWLTLKELLDYDWTRKHKSCGYVGEAEYVNILLGKVPDRWCGGVGGGSVRVVEGSEMVDIIYGKKEREPDAQYYVHCWFDVGTYKDCAGSFYTKTMEVLKTLIPKGGTEEDVRIVFDFDS